MNRQVLGLSIIIVSVYLWYYYGRHSDMKEGCLSNLSYWKDGKLEKPFFLCYGRWFAFFAVLVIVGIVLIAPYVLEKINKLVGE